MNMEAEEKARLQSGGQERTAGLAKQDRLFVELSVLYTVIQGCIHILEHTDGHEAPSVALMEQFSRVEALVLN